MNNEWWPAHGPSWTKTTAQLRPAADDAEDRAIRRFQVATWLWHEVEAALRVVDSRIRLDAMLRALEVGSTPSRVDAGRV